MSESPAPLRVLVADDDASARETIAEMIRALGHEVVAEVASGREAVTTAAAAMPDVVLMDVFMPDGSGIDAAIEIRESTTPAAVVLITGDEELRLSDDEVVRTAAFSLAHKPIKRNALDGALRLAVRRVRELGDAKQDAATARQQLADRKQIERAKGILMRRTGLGEQECYKIMQRTSQDKSIPMVAVAKTILDSEPK